MSELRRVISGFDERVVFADLNLKLNILWISMRPGPEGCIAVVEAIKAAIPEAMLVASQYEAMMGMAGGRRRRSSQSRFKWLGLGRG